MQIIVEDIKNRPCVFEHDMSSQKWRFTVWNRGQVIRSQYIYGDKADARANVLAKLRQDEPWEQMELAL